VLRVVGELRAALAELEVALHVAGLLEVLGILQSHDDGDLALLLGAVEVGGVTRQRKQVCVAAYEALPAGQERERVVDDLRSTRADRVMKGRDAGGAERGLFLLAERLRE